MLYAGEIQNTLTPVDLNERIVKIASKDCRVDNNTEEFQKGYWRASFEEGIDPKDINDGQLPKPGETDSEFFCLKLINTLWSYDFQFETPSCMSKSLISKAQILISISRFFSFSWECKQTMRQYVVEQQVLE